MPRSQSPKTSVRAFLLSGAGVVLSLITIYGAAVRASATVDTKVKTLETDVATIKADTKDIKSKVDRIMGHLIGPE